MRDPAKKIRSLERVKDELPTLRARGLTVVLANGVFDLFHVGHIRYLAGARAEGDFLIVAVNADESARELKGEGRPFLPEGERAEIVAALECVDRVVVFRDRTVGELLTALRPDVHAKGTDYTVDSVPERSLSAQLGIRTAIVGDPKDHSSTDLLRTIRDSLGQAP